MLKKLLIANRGEIAIRIAQAAAELGIATVGIHSEDDATSLHVRRVDEARALKGKGAAAYLDIGGVVAAAKAAGCDSVHPGYGFLSENSVFARACVEAGLVFVGPTPEQLDLFGDKAKARAHAAETGAPLLPGTDGATDLAGMKAFFALHAGTGIMIKAIAGGGGRGMRAVRKDTEIAEAFERCGAEAKAAFGNGTLYAERLIDRARHIEVQIVGDGKGGIVAFGERDCTIQRRNQKIVEMAPSPGLGRPAPEDHLGRGGHGQGREVPQPRHVRVPGRRGQQAAVLLLHRGQSQAAGRAHRHRRGLWGRPGEGTASARRRGQSGGGRDGRRQFARLRHPASRQHGDHDRRRLGEARRRHADGLRAAGRPGVRVDTYGYAGYRTNPNFDSCLPR